MSRAGASIVFDLTSLRHARKPEYIARALRSIAAERRRAGLPRWTVIDEAHYVVGAGPAPCAEHSPRCGTSSS